MRACELRRTAPFDQLEQSVQIDPVLGGERIGEVEAESRVQEPASPPDQDLLLLRQVRPRAVGVGPHAW